jgi:hypothetical protein
MTPAARRSAPILNRRLTHSSPRNITEYISLRERSPLDNIEVILDLPIAVHVAAICFTVCVVTLLVLLITAPWRDCFFMRWSPEVRFLALVVSPAMLIVWPIVLYWWFLKSMGVGPDDLDFDDD